MPTCHLVMGTPRSGTSCVAGVLHKLGIHMGDRMIDADPMNPAGYYQDIEFEECFDSLPEFMPQYPITLAPEIQDRLRVLVAERCSRGIDWGFKTSKTAYALPIIQAACTQPIKLIVTRRIAASSVQSWTRWSEPHDQPAAEVIERASDAIRQAVAASGLPTFVVDYNALQGTIVKTVTDLAAFVGRPVNQDAIDHITPALRNY